MTAFEFATAGRVIFGDGASAGVPELAAGWGARVLVVAASEPARAEWLVAGLEERGAEVVLLCVEDEPDTPFVEGGAGLARRRGIEAVVGLGGGSALDAAKAIAALATNPGELMDYLEVVGRGQPITVPPLPLVAVPTTAGTGSEVTRNAVVTVPGRRVKVSLRSPLMLPRVAVVDPRLTYGLPPALTASTGLDALTQLIEPFLSVRANPVTDALCREGLARAARSLGRACENGRDAAARTDMSLASVLGGMALASAGLGAVHALAAPIGGMFRAPHGAICAALLPHVMAANLRAFGEGRGQPDALGRMAEIGRLVTRSSEATAEDAVAWIRGTVARLEMPGLSRYGMAADALPEVAAQGLQASSMKGNPVALSAAELVGILEAAL